MGRLASVEKLIEQSADECGAGGGAGGAEMVTVVFAVAVWPLSSATLQVIPTSPVGAPAEANSAVVPLPVTEPAEAV